MLLKVHPENPQKRHLNTIKECLKDGGVIIYPTDTVYGIGCDIFNRKAVEKVARLKGIKPEKADFSIICYDLSDLSDYTTPIHNTIFKFMKKALPGPFTFILEANSTVPKLFKTNKKSIGIRVPDNNIARTIVRELGNPIVSTSVHDDDEIIEYTTDPELIHERYKNDVDIVVDGGYGNNEASTVVDCRNNKVEVIREGMGIIEGDF